MALRSHGLGADVCDIHGAAPIRHQWRKNDILLWDNRCTLHRALANFDQHERRLMERTTVRGTPSVHAVTA